MNEKYLQKLADTYGYHLPHNLRYMALAGLIEKY
jgi:hypothetical protein